MIIIRGMKRNCRSFRNCSNRDCCRMWKGGGLKSSLSDFDVVAAGFILVLKIQSTSTISGANLRYGPVLVDGEIEVGVLIVVFLVAKRYGFKIYLAGKHLANVIQVAFQLPLHNYGFIPLASY